MAATITASPRQAHSTCRMRKWWALPWRSSASTLDALHTITIPVASRARVTAKSVMSDDSFLAKLPRQGADGFLEDTPAVGVVLEHVEGGAGGRQDHGVAGHGAREGLLNGIGHVGAGDDRHHAAERERDALARLADGEDGLAVPGQ